MPDFFDVVHSQRAARSFLPDDVDDETVARILTAATHAPSAENSQPFVFVVVRDPAIRAAIGEMTARIWQGGARALEEERLSPAFLRDVDRGAMGGIAAAPVLVVVCGDTRLTFAQADGRLGVPGRAEPAPRRRTRSVSARPSPRCRCSAARSCPTCWDCRPRSCRWPSSRSATCPSRSGRPGAGRCRRRHTWTVTARRSRLTRPVPGTGDLTSGRQVRGYGEPVQEHHYYVDIEATVDELWQLFWARIPHTESGDVTIDILHPGDAVGEGLVRHCTFRVPRYLLTGGKGQSWEWLTEVTPKESWKYNAVGRPLFSEAEGHTRLEDLGDGTHRVHFSETYHAFNPVLRVLLEKRVHAFISKDNDRLIKESLTTGVRYLRAAKAKAKREGRRQGGRAAPHPTPTVTVVDLWVNALHRQGRRGVPGPAGQRGHPRAARVATSRPPRP